MNNSSVCPLCASQRSRPFDRRLFRDRPVHNQVCLRCSLVFQSPRMSTDEIDAFYAAEYRRLYQGSQGPDRKDLAVQQLRAASLVSLIRPLIPSIRRHLDVGCSAGSFLEATRQAYGCQVNGVEPGEAYRRFARARKLDVHPSLSDLPGRKKDRYDLISLVHVLEHLPDPVATLRQLRQDLLEAGGWLLLEVPNLYCHDSFEIAHLASFSRHTLLEALAAAGFEPRMLLMHGRPRSRILPLYITVLAQSGREPGMVSWSPEHAVLFKRRLGLLRRRLLEKLLPGLAWLPLREGQE